MVYEEIIKVIAVIIILIFSDFVSYKKRVSIFHLILPVYAINSFKIRMTYSNLYRSEIFVKFESGSKIFPKVSWCMIYLEIKFKII